MHIHRTGRTINMAGQVAGNLRQSLRQNAPNANGIPMLLLKKSVSAVATTC